MPNVLSLEFLHMNVHSSSLCTLVFYATDGFSGNELLINNFEFEYVVTLTAGQSMIVVLIFLSYLYKEILLFCAYAVTC